MDKYLLIKFSEDGDLPRVEHVSAEELRKRLKEHYYGERPKFAEPGKDVNGEYSGGVLVVIKGEIVVPKAVQVATEWDL